MTRLTAHDLNEDDWQHIFGLIIDGFKSGEICSFQSDETETSGWWEMTSAGIAIT